MKSYAEIMLELKRPILYGDGSGLDATWARGLIEEEQAGEPSTASASPFPSPAPPPVRHASRMGRADPGAKKQGALF